MRQPAVRAACHRALEARERILLGYPRWEDWRAEARSIKAEAIFRLDGMLARLTRRVEAWGGQVFVARDGDAAREYILETSRRHKVRTVVKSKSMTTEELGLTHFLADAGLRVTETDLGEFIIQLAGHPPAHLTNPAMHLDRRRIAAIFQERLEEACPPEPEALTRLAARHLGPLYRQADMGVTGVNFAGAADGTLVLLENEGNLRLTATLPRVHLAVMGLEKVIPAVAQVEVFLRLLPASATGQRLTALVHFIRGLKPHPRGSQAFHLVLLDNGRRQLAQEPELMEALYCLRCGACLNICPVFQIGAAHLYRRVYPGAIGILLAPYLDPKGDISDLCTQCGACTDICPVKIPLAAMIVKARAHSAKLRRWRYLSRAAGLGLAWPRVYRRWEGGLRLLPWLPLESRIFLGMALSPQSFHKHMGNKGETAAKR